MNHDPNQPYPGQPGQPEEQRGYQGYRPHRSQPDNRGQQSRDEQREQRGRHAIYNAGHPLGSTSIDLQPNFAAALSYLGWWLTGLIFVISERRNRFVRFHAMQSILTFAILSLVWLILQLIFSIPIIGLVGCVLRPVLIFATLALWLGLMAIALLGRKIKIPVIGDLAERLAGHDKPV